MPTYSSSYTNGGPRHSATFPYDGHPDALDQKGDLYNTKEALLERLEFQNTLSSSQASGPYPTDSRKGRDRIGEGSETKPTDALRDVTTVMNMLLNELIGVTTDGTALSPSTVDAGSFLPLLYAIERGTKVQGALAAQGNLNRIESITKSSLVLARELMHLKRELAFILNNHQIDLTVAPKYPSDKNQYVVH